MCVCVCVCVCVGVSTCILPAGECVDVFMRARASVCLNPTYCYRRVWGVGGFHACSVFRQVTLHPVSLIPLTADMFRALPVLSPGG